VTAHIVQLTRDPAHATPLVTSAPVLIHSKFAPVQAFRSTLLVWKRGLQALLLLWPAAFRAMARVHNRLFDT